jgi:hypothetical protein
MLDVLRNLEELPNIQLQIVEQSNDGRRFNLGKMMNVGFDLYSRSSVNNDWVYMFHPIDLFPKSGVGVYLYGMDQILNGAADILRYNVMGQSHFYRACQYSPSVYREFNGYTNRFWGWGAEDDEFFNRLRLKQLHSKFLNVEFNTWCETKEDHEPDHQSPDYLTGLDHHSSNLALANSITSESMMVDGLSSLSYTVLSENTISKNIKHIEVEL